MPRFPQLRTPGLRAHYPQRGYSASDRLRMSQKIRALNDPDPLRRQNSAMALGVKLPEQVAEEQAAKSFATQQAQAQKAGLDAVKQAQKDAARAEREQAAAQVKAAKQQQKDAFNAEKDSREKRYMAEKRPTYIDSSGMIQPKDDDEAWEKKKSDKAAVVKAKGDVAVQQRGITATEKAISDVDSQFSLRRKELAAAAVIAKRLAEQGKNAPNAAELAGLARAAQEAADNATLEEFDWERGKQANNAVVNTERAKVEATKAQLKTGVVAQPEAAPVAPPAPATQQSQASPAIDPGKSAKWNQMQAELERSAQAAGLPDAGGDARKRLTDAISRAEKITGKPIRHFTGQPNEPDGDRSSSIDIENLIRVLPAGKERDYWQNVLKTTGMTAEQWKRQTGEDDPQLPPPVPLADRMTAHQAEVANFNATHAATSKPFDDVVAEVRARGIEPLVDLEDGGRGFAPGVTDEEKAKIRLAHQAMEKGRPALDAKAQELNQRGTTLQEEAKQEDAKQQQAIDQQVSKMAATPGMAETAGKVKALDAEFRAIRDKTQDPGALKAASEEYQKQRAALLSEGEAKSKEAWKAMSDFRAAEFAATEKGALDKTGDVSRLAGNPAKRKEYLEALEVARKARADRGALKTGGSAELQAKRDELGKKYGLTPEQSKNLFSDIGKLSDDWGNDRFSPTKSRVLSDGRVVVNPALWVDPDAYEKAVKESGAPESGQKDALAMLPGLREEASTRLLNAVAKSEKLAPFINDLPGKTDVERAAALLAIQRKSPVFNAIAARLNASAESMAGGIMGLISMATGNEWTTESMQRWNERASAHEALAGTSGLGPKMNFATKIPAGVESLAPALIGGASFGTAARALGAGEKVIEKAALTGAAIAGGAQSTGGTYGNAFEAYLKANGGKDMDEARKSAILPALASGLITTATTLVGGPKGFEALFRAPAGRQLVKSALWDAMKKAGVRVVQEGHSEFWEEAVDQIGQGILERATFNPQKPIADIIREGLEAGGIGAVIGGAVGAANPGKKPPSPIQRAAAIGGSDSELSQNTPQSLAARVLRDIAQGAQMIDLRTDELAAIGMQRNEKGEIKPAKGKDALPPAISIENGKPVILQPAIDEIRANFPQTGALIGEDEVEARKRLAAPTEDEPAMEPAPTAEPAQSEPIVPGEGSPGEQVTEPQTPDAYTYLTPGGETWWSEAERLQANYFATQPNTPERKAARDAFNAHTATAQGTGNKLARLDSTGNQISPLDISLAEQARPLSAEGSPESPQATSKAVVSGAESSAGLTGNAPATTGESVVGPAQGATSVPPAGVAPQPISSVEQDVSEKPLDASSQPPQAEGDATIETIVPRNNPTEPPNTTQGEGPPPPSASPRTPPPVAGNPVAPADKALNLGKSWHAKKHGKATSKEAANDARFVTLLAEALKRKSKVFSKVEFKDFPPGKAGAALEAGGVLEIDLPKLAEHVNRFSVRSAKAMEEFVAAIVQEEADHRAFVHLYETDADFREKADAVWSSLPDNLKKQSADAYFAALGGGKFDKDFVAMAEFFRQYNRDPKFAARVERIIADSGIIGKLRELVKAFLKALKSFRKKFPELAAQMDDLTAQVEKTLARLEGVEESSPKPPVSPASKKVESSEGATSKSKSQVEPTSKNEPPKKTISFGKEPPGGFTEADRVQPIAKSTTPDEIGARIAEAEASGVVFTDADKKAIREVHARATDLRAQANRKSLSGSDPLNKGNAFPMGVGFTKMTKRAEQRIDSSVRKAGEAVVLSKRAEAAETTVASLLSDKGTEADVQRKAAKKEEGQRGIVSKLLNWKKGDKIGGFTIERVNLDRDGYPTSYTFSGDGIVKGDDKMDVVRVSFDGDKAKFRRFVDEARAAKKQKNATPPAKDESAPLSTPPSKFPPGTSFYALSTPPSGPVQNVEVVSPQGRIAYHGTPHKVDRFSTEKVGTGEGAQAYGWGIYFAEAPDVAADYRKRLTDWNSPGIYEWNGQEFASDDFKSPERHAVAHIFHNGIPSARKLASDMLADARRGEAYTKDQGGLPYYERFAEVVASIKSKKDIKFTQGNLYTVELLPDEDEFLDWDKSLVAQSDKVRDAMEGLIAVAPSPNDRFRITFAGQYLAGDFDDRTQAERHLRYERRQWDGKKLYSALSNSEAASRLLHSKGIKGIRYLDGGSRGTGKGTSNYVIFNESDIRITHENGKPITASEAVSHSLSTAPGIPPVPSIIRLAPTQSTRNLSTDETPEAPNPISPESALAVLRGEDRGGVDAQGGRELPDGDGQGTAEGQAPVPAIRRLPKLDDVALLMGAKDLKDYGHSEHNVWRIGNAAIKLTYGTRRTPEEYLERLIFANSEFDDDIRVLGWIDDPADGDQMVIMQPWIDGKPASESEIDAYMAKKGYRPLGKGMYERADGQKVADLVGRNVLKDDAGNVHVVDFLTPAKSTLDTVPGGDSDEEVAARLEVSVPSEELTEEEIKELDEFYAEGYPTFPSISDIKTVDRLNAELSEDLPSEEDLKALQDRHALEVPGKFTVGDPEIANPGQTEDQRKAFDVVRDIYGDTILKQETLADWDAKGKKRAEEDPAGVQRMVLEAYANGASVDNPVDMRAAKHVFNKLWTDAVLSGDPRKLREASIFGLAYTGTRSETARTLAAGRDTTMTKQERFNQFIAEAISEPVRLEDKVRLEELPRAADKSRQIDALQKQIDKLMADKKHAEAREKILLRDAKRKMPTREDAAAEMAKKQQTDIAKALKKEGLTIADLLDGRVEFRVKFGRLVVEAMGKKDPTREKAIDLLVHGWSTNEIVRATKMNPEQVGKLREELRSKPQPLREALARMIQKGLDITKIAANALSTAPGAPAMAWEDALAEADRILEKLIPTKQEADQSRWRKVKRKTPRPGSTPDAALERAIERLENPTVKKVSEDAMRDLIRLHRTKKGVPGFVKKAELLGGDPALVRQTHQLIEQERARKARQPVEVDLDVEYVPFDLNDKAKAYRVMRLTKEATKGAFDMATEFWINSILSGPLTHVVNTLGNAASALWDLTFQRAGEAVAGTALKGAGAKGTVRWGEFPQMVKGILPGIMAGWRMAGEAWSTEADLFEDTYLNSVEEVEEEIDKHGPQPAISESPLTQIGRTLGKTGERVGAALDAGFGKFGRLNPVRGRVVRIPGRALRMVDSFFKNVIGHIEAGAQAYRIGRAQGLKGESLREFIKMETTTPGSMSWAAAVEKAKELTFQDDSVPVQVAEAVTRAPLSKAKEYEARALARAKAGDMLGARRAVNAAKWLRRIQNVMRFVFPFVRTPVNIFRMGLRKTPLGSVAMAWHLAKGLNGAVRGQGFFNKYPAALMAKHLTEQAFAWGALTMLYALGEGDDDDDKKRLLLVGGRPYSTGAGITEFDQARRLYGGTNMLIFRDRNGNVIVRVPFGRIEPFATALGSMVDAMRTLKQHRKSTEGGSEKARAVAHAIAANMLGQAEDKTFLRGIADVSRAWREFEDTESGGKAAVAYGTNLLAGFVPNIIKQPLRNMDAVERNSKQASGLHHFWPSGRFANPMVDLFGRDVTKSGSPIQRIFWPALDEASPELTNKLLESWNFEHPFRLKGDENKDKSRYLPDRADARNYKVKENGKERPMTLEEMRAYDQRAGEQFRRSQSYLTPEQARAGGLEDIKRLRQNLSGARKGAKSGSAPPQLAPTPYRVQPMPRTASTPMTSMERVAALLKANAKR